jgi:hypothetical protein
MEPYRAHLRKMVKKNAKKSEFIEIIRKNIDKNLEK